MKRVLALAVLMTVPYIHAEDDMVIGRHPNRYAPVSQAQLDEQLRTLRAQGKKVDRNTILQASARMRGLEVTTTRSLTPGVRGVQTPVAANRGGSTIPTGPRSTAVTSQTTAPAPVSAPAPAPASFQYIRPFSNIVIDFVDQDGLNASEKLRLQKWMANFPNEHLKGLKKITIKKGGCPVVGEGEFKARLCSVQEPVFAPGEIVLWSEESHEFLEEDLADLIGSYYYQNGMTAQDRQAFDALTSDKRYPSYRFGSAYGSYLGHGQSHLEYNTKAAGENEEGGAQDLQQSLYIASLFAHKNTQNITMFDEMKPSYERAFVGTRIGGQQYLTIGKINYALRDGKIIGSTNEDVYADQTFAYRVWDPAVSISNTVLNRFATKNFSKNP